MAKRVLTFTHPAIIVRCQSTVINTAIDGIHPLIDVGPLLNEHDTNREDTLNQIAEALQCRGYFYARGVSMLPGDYIKSIYDYSQRLHKLPVDVKQQFLDSGAYTGPDAGQAELQYEPGTVATVRAWDYSRRRFTLGTFDGDSRFPDSSVLEPSYAIVLDDLYERQNQLASALLVAFAEVLGVPKLTLKQMFDGDDGCGDFGTIRLLNYPGNSATSSAELDNANVGISAHTDFEAFTLMHQNAPGLQFVPATGEGWIDAPVRTGEFVVIIGDILERITNGFLKATPHRVVKTHHQRLSIIRFNAVAPETVVSPLSKFVTEERPARYGAVTMRTHMETTMRNLAAGRGSWDPVRNRSTTSTYEYIDGKDPAIDGN